MNTLTEVFMELAGASWRVSGLLLVLVALRFCLRRFLPVGWLFAAWVVLSGALLVPVRLPVTWPALAVPQIVTPKPMPAGPAIVRAGGNMAPAVRLQSGTGPTRPTEPMVDLEVFETSLGMLRSLIGVFALLWAGGALLLLGLRVVSASKLRSRLTKTGSAADPVLRAMVARSCREIGVAREPVVLTTPLVASPALCGLIRPHLLFPPGLVEKLGPDELRLVVLHELGHLRRHDLWSQAALQVAVIVHWFNPVVWLAVRLARLDCELACDEFVLKREPVGKTDDYGRTLLKVLGAVRGETRLPATLGIVESKRQFLTRITMITNYRPQTLRRTLAGAALLAAFALVGYTEEAKQAPVFSPAEMTAMPSETRRQTMQERATAERAARERQFLEWADAGKIVLRAIGAPGGVPVAVFDVDGEPKVVVEDSGLVAGRVTVIDGANGRVTVSFGKNGLREFLLTNPRPVKFPEISPKQFEFLVTPAARRSVEDNRVPSELVFAWSAINPEGKEAILMNYLRRGLVVDVHSDAKGAGTSIQRLFAKQISQRVRERREAFVASLTAEQRERFGGGAEKAIRLDATPAESAAAIERSNTAKAKRDRVIAELTSEQRMLYDLWQAAMAL
jgi:beta-lactamase regulating signal transducer with metallopeptidase domain